MTNYIDQSIAELKARLEKLEAKEDTVPSFKFALREDLKDDKRFIPSQANDTDTGYDVRAAQADKNPLVVKPFEYVKIPLGFRAFCPPGYWYKLVPRSSTFAKKQLHALYGTVDEGYQNEAIFAAQYIPYVEPVSELEFNDHFYDAHEWYEIEEDCMEVHTRLVASDLTINFGDAVGQIIPVKRQSILVDEVSNDDYNKLCEERKSTRNGGFGSSDQKGFIKNGEK